MEDGERFGRTLALAHKAMQECIDERMAEHGASLATWLVLHHAVEEPDLSQSHLAARLVIEAPTLVRHLDRLEADGLLERRRDARDRLCGDGPRYAADDGRGATPLSRTSSGANPFRKPETSDTVVVSSRFYCAGSSRCPFLVQMVEYWCRC